MNYKKILIGTNMAFPHWLMCMKKIKKPNIILHNFNINLEKTIQNNNIDYILPLSKKDYDLAMKTNHINKIIYPGEENILILNNKLHFTKFMLENFPQYIPKVYYLENVQLEKDILYPLIFKPIYSTNGKNMFVIKNYSELELCKNKIIIQEFVNLTFEYSAFFLCVEGKIINIKILKNQYPQYHIKKTNFVKYEEVIGEHFNIIVKILNEIIVKLNYSGGGNIDFKYNEETGLIRIFEFNPRFGGSAFSNNFIYELLCVE